ncbi:MAG: dihydroorotate dehydrogenase [Bacteroidales bacterium]|jgi:dihydroorotate dehydrogenase (NAD+) catalytic subunit|nr:dihydroorotate dehydrogenase [Bacteroidales bacterium]
MENSLATTINGVTFKNPIIAASGTFGFGSEYHQLYDVGILGGISSKGLTINRKEGNAGLRIWETSGGIMNSVGLQNPGVKQFIAKELPNMKAFDNVVIANLGGSNLEDYLEGILLLNETDIDFIELNISCPNVKAGGMAFGIKDDVAYSIVKQAKNMAKKPLMVKLSPNAENIVTMAQACENAGADSLSLINTLKGMAIDIKNKKTVFNNFYAGYSGIPIKPIALRMVHEVCKNVSIPVVGMGGIYTVSDVIEFIMAGAHAVQIGTVNFSNPLAGKELVDGLAQYFSQENIKNIDEIRGII